ncbi:Serine/threonine-protein kinase CLA4 [Elsinoe australis]|uniref:AA9 family lytic polysaccharide monooxygenase n=1 Tax=Elsinoe australis TaxID=40998 RepID=A0A2P7ZD94_9PEZI|nr:Serine/threonine-protein kinase CLA4 [Elsinoe australis]
MKSFAFVPLLAATATAHTTFQALWVDGKSTGKMEQGAIRHKWQNTPESNYPTKDASSPDIACGKYATGPAPVKVSIKAGSEVTAEWHHEPTQNSGDKDEPIALSHKGPIMAYLGKVDNSATASTTGVKWFKIYEDTKDSSGTWAVERFYNNKGMIPFTIPSCVADGDYFLRVEIIGLHEADRSMGAQMYPNCAQISITGGGNANPETVSFPGAYENNGVGLSYNLYSGNAPYTAPGPRPFTCGAGGNAPAQPSSPAPSSSAAPAPTTLQTSTRASSSSVRPVTTSKPATSAPAAYPTTSAQANPAPTSSAAPAPSSPAGGAAPSRQEIESFFGQIMALYNTWKGQVGA